MAETTTTPVVQNTNSGMIGSIVSTVGGLVSGFNYKAQENQIELARIQSEAAQAAANTGEKSYTKYIYIGIAVVVVIVLFVALKPKN